MSVLLQMAIGALANSPVVCCLRQDRVLSASFLLLFMTSVAPLFAAPILPLTDVGFNGHAGLLPGLALGDHFLNQYYQINWRPMPYWSAYALQGLLSLVVGPLLAVKALLALLILALPLALMRLAISLGRDPRLCLFAFLLVWDKNIYWGWLAFQLGMVLCLWVLARLNEVRTLKHAFWLWPGVALVGMSHPHAIALLAVAGAMVVLSQRPFIRGALRGALALSGTLLTVAPWVLHRLAAQKGAAVANAAYRITNPTIAEKLSALHAFTFDNYVDPGAKTWAATGFVLLLFAPAILAALPSRRAATPLASVGAVFFGALALYLALPFEIWGPVSHWWTYPRYGTFVLLGALLLPRADLGGLRILYLIPIALAAIGIHFSTYRQFSEFGSRNAAFVEIIDALPMHQRLYPVSYRHKDPAVTGHVLVSFHGYAAMAKRAFDPHLFDVQDIPVVYKKSLPKQNFANPTAFSFERYGQYYDYILLYPEVPDPLRRAVAEGKVSLTKRAGPWRLYKVLQPVAAP